MNTYTKSAPQVAVVRIGGGNFFAVRLWYL